MIPKYNSCQAENGGHCVTSLTMTADFTISVVDDDESIRNSLESLLKSMGYTVESFPSAESFLNAGGIIPKTDCLILDVCMPGMSGTELQKELKNRRLTIPVIFITAHSNSEWIARTIGDGAVNCLLKPFSEEDLLKAIHRALLG